MARSVTARPEKLVEIALKVSESATLMEAHWGFRPKTVTVSAETEAELRGMGFGYLVTASRDMPDVFCVDIETTLSAAGL